MHVIVYLVASKQGHDAAVGSAYSEGETYIETRYGVNKSMQYT